MKSTETSEFSDVTEFAEPGRLGTFMAAFKDPLASRLRDSDETTCRNYCR